MACRRPPTRAQYCCKTKKKSRSRRRHRSKGKKRSCRPGKITRNPFFNFLRYFRKKHCGWSAVKVAVEGAKCWCKLSDEQRKKFYKEACGAPPFRRKKSRCGGRSRGRSRGRSKRRSRKHSRRRSRKRSRSHGGLCGGGSRKKKRSHRRKRSRSSACHRPRKVKSLC